MRIDEITDADKTQYKLKFDRPGEDRTFDKDLESIPNRYNVAKTEYARYGKSKSLRDRRYVHSTIGNLMNTIRDLDDICIDCIQDSNDQESIDIRNKLTPIYNDLEKMLNIIQI